LADVDLLFDRSEGGAGGGELGGGFREAGGHVVEFLLRDKVRTLLGDGGETVVGELADLEGRFGAGDFAAGADDFEFAPFFGSLGLDEFLLEFGDFEETDQLAFAEAVTDFDGQRFDISSDFGMDVDLLPRAKFSGEFEIASEIDAQNGRDGNGSEGGLWRLASGWAAGCAEEEEEKGDEEAHEAFSLSHRGGGGEYGLSGIFGGV